MKCKTGYKKRDGNCVRKKKIFGKKQFFDIQMLISLLIFIIFSVVLFVNNSTQLFDRYGWHYQMNYVTWIAIAGSIVYGFWRVITKRDLI